MSDEVTVKNTWVHRDDLSQFAHIDLTDKDSVTRLLIFSMLQKTNSMFEWKGLPNTIPVHYLEHLLQENGSAGFIKKGDKYFAVRGSAGGVRNYNYAPMKYIVSNPWLLEQSTAYDIYYGKDSYVESPIRDDLKTDGECVVIENDNMCMGLIPICQLYASQLTENFISLRLVTILSRCTYIFAAGSTDIKNDFNSLIKDVENGKLSSILAEGLFGDGVTNVIKTLPMSENGHQALTDLIEAQQYIRANWLNEFGLQANYNMKRESINSNESQLNKDAVLPFVDTMLSERKIACERINELFGLNVSVEFSSAWGYTRQTIEQAIDAIDQTTDMKQTKNEEVDNSNGQEEQKVDNSNGQGGEDNE